MRVYISTRDYTTPEKLYAHYAALSKCVLVRPIGYTTPAGALDITPAPSRSSDYNFKKTVYIYHINKLEDMHLLSPDEDSECVLFIDVP